MTTPNESQPQDEILVDPGPAGVFDDNDQSPLLETEPAGVLDGAEPQEPEPSPAPRTYTQEEWSKRESAKDREIAQIRQAMVELTQKMSEGAKEAAEREASLADQYAVVDGEITMAEAEERKRKRASDYQEQEIRNRERISHQQLQAHYEQMGRVEMAKDLAAELGVDANALIHDETITNPLEMKLQAQSMALEKERAEKQRILEEREAELQGTETYHQTQTGSTGAGVGSYAEQLRSGGPLPTPEEIDRRVASRFRNI